LRIRRFTSPIDNNYLILIFIASLLPFIITGCAERTILGYGLMEFKQKIQSGDHAFLTHIDYEKYHIDDIKQLGDGAAFYMHFIFQKLNLKQLAYALLELEMKQGVAPWNQEAGLLLVDYLYNEDENKQTADYARYFLNRFPDSQLRSEVEKLFIQALYWEKEDVQVLKAISDYLKAYEDDNYFNEQGEMILFKAVGAYRLKLPGWADYFRELFLKVDASELHKRAYSFLTQDDSILSNFLSWEADLFKAKNYMARGLEVEAINLMKAVFNQLDVTRFESVVLIRDFGYTSFQTGGSKQDAQVLVTLAVKLSNPEKLIALEFAARVYRKINQNQQAETLFRQVASGSEDPEQKDRVNWFLLDIGIRTNSHTIIPLIRQISQDWSDAQYFADILDSYVSKVLTNREWDKIQELYNMLRNTTLDEITARLCYILAKAIDLGYLNAEGQKKEEYLEELLNQAINKDSYRYYLVLCSALLKQTPIFYKEKATESYQCQKKTDTEKLVCGFFDYGLDRQAYNLMVEKQAEIEENTILYALNRLYNREFFYEAIHLLNILYFRRNRDYYSEEMSIYYPLAYGIPIRDLAKKYGIYDFVLNALVRQESAFDKDIVSYAGAVGLSQLMPATASDVAKRLGIEQVDLNDALQNLEMGAWYFKEQLKRFHSLPLALAAYNAGPTRVRNWANELNFLPIDLLVEAIPLSQPRNFIKRIFVSTIIYNNYYLQRDPLEVLDAFFPSLNNKE
jgi:soluble lytic murein transglycosylase-like protein